MRWYWRALIAILVGLVYSGLSLTVFDSMPEAVNDWLAERLPWPRYTAVQIGITIPIAYFLPVLLVSAGTYGLLSTWLGPRRIPDGETRCRKCDYILRGISEPRCPECGERI